MAGNHRAKKRSVWPGILAAVVAVGLIAVAGFVATRVLRGDDPSDSTSDSASTGSTSDSPSESTDDSTSPSAATESPSEDAGSPSTSPTLPAPETTDLAAASDSSPRRITVDGLMDRGFDIAVSETDGQLLPASGDEVSRWAERGRPGSPGSDTVFLVGSTDAEDAFNGVPEMRKGTEITVTTDVADLTYTVIATDSVTDPLAKKKLTADVPGRLVLLGTDGYGASPEEPVRVVIANLTAVS